MENKPEQNSEKPNTLPLVSLLLYRKFAIASDKIAESNKKPPLPPATAQR